MATATYRFVLPGRYIGKTVTVFNQSGTQVASGAVGADGTYSVALAQGDYYATTQDGRYIDADQVGRASSSDAFAPQVTFSDLTKPYFIGHRGLANVYPEETMEGFRATVAAGIRMLELDVVLLADGSLGVLHDSTLDRTTTSAGNASDLSSAAWSLLNCDAGAWFNPKWPNTMKAPLLDDVLREFGNKVVLIIEGKSQTAVAALVTALDRYKINKNAVVVEGATASWLAPATAAGYRTLVISNDGAIDPATYAALGINIVCFNGPTVADSYVASILAAGMEPWVFNVTRHWERDKYIALGVTGFISDDALYMSGSGYLRTTDPFADGTWYHGILDPSNGNGRGGFVGVDEWGFTTAAPGNQRNSLMGWGSPVAGNPANDNYTITATVTMTSGTSTTRFGSVVFGCPTDMRFLDSALTGSNGYHGIIRKDGTLGLYVVNNGVATSIATQSVGAVAIADGGTATVKATVTPTTVKFERTDVAYATTAVANTAYRGGYFHLGMNGLVATWKDVTVA